MTVTIRLFATLREGRGKELIRDVDEAVTPRKLAADLSIPENEIAILLINGRDGLLDENLTEGDRISIFPPVGGG